ncbi:hypothetical protein ACH40E_11005 [Streptomyces acidicola]|uniref:hypothetical protein n=1 Tax=Streptomyces acidicola TaxID=2596892 RepID=UPI003794D155
MDPGIHERAAARAEEFLAYVRGNGMLDLVRLPLLAHLAVGQYSDPAGERRVQARRVDLYAGAVAEFLGRFPQRQSPYEPYVRDRVEELLGRLRERHAREAPRHAAVTAALRGFLGDPADTYLRHGTPVVDAAAELLADPADGDPYRHRAVTALLEATGLVVDVHTAHPRFLHRTFAEYLAAEHLRDRYGTDPVTWGDALSDADTRIAALFAIDRHPADVQRGIASRLAADPERVEQAALLLAEGMCDDERRGRVLDLLWRHPDEREEETPPVVRNWQQTHTALAHLPQQQRRLHDMATDPGSVPVDRINAAAALAGHDPRGTDLLRAFAHDGSYPLDLRIAAAWYLAHVDRASGTELLTRFADDAPSRHCALAAARLADHDTSAGTSRLRALVADPRCPDLAKVDAAIGLCAHDRTAGTDWLRRFAADRRFFADCRVYAADALARTAEDGDQTRTEATLLLERIARDERVDAGYRVEAAHRLARYRADAGTLILRDFADGALPGRYTCDAAVLLAQHDRAADIRTLGAIARAVGQEPQHRLRAALELAHYEPTDGEAQLAVLAGEPGWDEGPRIRAAALLAGRNREAGLPLLRSYATELADEARVVGYDKGLYRRQIIGGRIRSLHDGWHSSPRTFFRLNPVAPWNLLVAEGGNVNYHYDIATLERRDAPDFLVQAGPDDKDDDLSAPRAIGKFASSPYGRLAVYEGGLAPPTRASATDFHSTVVQDLEHPLTLLMKPVSTLTTADADRVRPHLDTPPGTQDTYALTATERAVLAAAIEACAWAPKVTGG